MRRGPYRTGVTPDWYLRTDAVTRAFLDTLSGDGWRPVHALSVDEARAAERAAIIEDLPRPRATVERRTERVPVMGTERVVDLRIVWPASSSESCGADVAPDRPDDRFPVILYLHGGGWVTGDADVYDRFVRTLCCGIGAAAVFVEYSRAPEARFPIALEECLASIAWCGPNA
jgi:acetyl esterase